jgi:hypothetical protein
MTVREGGDRVAACFRGGGNLPRARQRRELVNPVPASSKMPPEIWSI